MARDDGLSEDLGRLSPAYRLMVLSARLNPGPECLEAMARIMGAGLDWEEAVRLAEALGVAPLLHVHAGRPRLAGLVPESARLGLSGKYRRMSLKNLRIHGQFRRIQAAFHDAGIPLVPLKGVCLGPVIYGDLGLRPMSDMDLLCREQDAASAAGLLETLGYRRDMVFRSPDQERLFVQTAGHLPPFHLPGFSPVEIHTGLFLKNKGGGLGVEDLDTFDIHPRTAFSSLSPCRLLSLEDHLLFLIHHLYRHFSRNDRRLPLYWFCDLHEWIVCFGKEMDWDRLLRRADALDTAEAATGICRLLRQHWQTPVPEKVFADRPATPRWLRLENYLDPKAHQKNYIAVALGNIVREWERAGAGAAFGLLWSFLFPSREFLKRHYGFTHQGQTVFYRLFHLFKIGRRALSSLMRLIRPGGRGRGAG